MRAFYQHAYDLYASLALEFFRRSEGPDNRAWWRKLSLEDQASVDAWLDAHYDPTGLLAETRDRLQVNFFTWLFSRPMESILELNFMTRLTQYVSDVDRPGIQEIFNESSLGIDATAPPGESGRWRSAEQANWLLDNKAGNVTFYTEIQPPAAEGDDAAGPAVTTFYNYTALPVYTVPAGNRSSHGTWFDFMYKIYTQNIESKALHVERPTWTHFLSWDKLKDVLSEEEHKNLEDLFFAPEGTTPRAAAKGADKVPPKVTQGAFGAEDVQITVDGEVYGAETFFHGGTYGDTNWPWISFAAAQDKTIADFQWPENFGQAMEHPLIRRIWADTGYRPSEKLNYDDVYEGNVHFGPGNQHDYWVANIHELMAWWGEGMPIPLFYNKAWWDRIDGGGWWMKYLFGGKIQGDIDVAPGGVANQTYEPGGADLGNLAWPGGKPEAFEKMKESYMAALDKTIYSHDIAIEVLRPIAFKVIDHLLKTGNPDLVSWIKGRLAFIEETPELIQPWNPNYDLTDKDWVHTKVLQDFLYQLQLTTFAENILGPLKKTHATHDPATKGPYSWNAPLNIGVDSWITTPQGPIASGWGFTLTDWAKNNSAAEFLGFIDYDGKVLDIAGIASRGYPYEYSQPDVTQMATLQPNSSTGKMLPGVLYNSADPKKDIYSLVQRFASAPPAIMMGKALVGMPKQKNAEGLVAHGGADFEILMQSFFIREQSTILALIHKILVEELYPELESNFDGTLSVASETLLNAIATANGDWSRVSKANSPASSSNPMGGFDFGALGMGMLKAFLGAMANTVDPTWKTPWPWNFGIGPLTPIGVAAKLLDSHNPGFSSTSKMRKDAAASTVCDDLVTEQTSLIKYGPLLDNPPSETEEK